MPHNVCGSWKHVQYELSTEDCMLLSYLFENFTHVYTVYLNYIHPTSSSPSYSSGGGAEETPLLAEELLVIDVSWERFSFPLTVLAADRLPVLQWRAPQTRAYGQH